LHPSAYEFATTALIAADVEGKRVLEAGAYNYNGTARHAIIALGPARYLGTDGQPGPGVDVVCPAELLAKQFGEGTADIVITTEMLEHAEDWRGAMTGITTVLAPAGLLLLTTRGPGFPYHPHPGDHWRFTVDQMGRIATWCGLEVIRLEPDPDPASPGVFLLARKPEDWLGVVMAGGLDDVEPGPPR
jgi:SAM-dependent methyltransferase